MNDGNFKKIARRLVIELAIVIALVSYNIKLPSHMSAAQSWKFASTHPTILLHILVGTVVIVEAILFVIRTLSTRTRFWIILALIGLVCVLLAYLSGERYVTTQNNSALTLMGNAGAGAIVVYSFGWYWGHKKAKPQKSQPTSEPQQSKTT